MKKLVSQLLANARAKQTKGFTLIELLIVIGILGILVVAVLLTLNPAEAQRRARDAKRMKDLGTVQSAVQQFVDGGGTPPAGGGGATWASDDAGRTTSCDGSAGWVRIGSGTTGINSLCPYINALPLDPTNGQTRAVAAPGGTCPTTTQTEAVTHYEFAMAGLTAAAPGTYEIRVRQESVTNCSNLNNDGGDDNNWSEAGSDLTLL